MICIKIYKWVYHEELLPQTKDLLLNHKLYILESLAPFFKKIEKLKKVNHALRKINQKLKIRNWFRNFNNNFLNEKLRFWYRIDTGSEK